MIYRHLPSPDFHRLDCQHYGLREDEDDDEYPRKAGGFFGCDMNTDRNAQKRQKFEFLQAPHSQRDPPSVHGEHEDDSSNSEFSWVIKASNPGHFAYRVQ